MLHCPSSSSDPKPGGHPLLLSLCHLSHANNNQDLTVRPHYSHLDYYYDLTTSFSPLGHDQFSPVQFRVILKKKEDTWSWQSTLQPFSRSHIPLKLMPQILAMAYKFTHDLVLLYLEKYVLLSPCSRGHPHCSVASPLHVVLVLFSAWGTFFIPLDLVNSCSFQVALSSHFLLLKWGPFFATRSHTAALLSLPWPHCLSLLQECKLHEGRNCLCLVRYSVLGASPMHSSFRCLVTPISFSYVEMVSPKALGDLGAFEAAAQLSKVGVA